MSNEDAKRKVVQPHSGRSSTLQTVIIPMGEDFHSDEAAETEFERNPTIYLGEPSEEERSQGRVRRKSLRPAPTVSLRAPQVLLGRPFFSIDRRPRSQPIHYQSPDGVYVTVTPSSQRGLATIFDADVLVGLTSLRIAALNKGVSLDQSARGVLCAMGQDAGGAQYRKLFNALARLAETRVETNVGTDGKPGDATAFTFVKSWEMRGGALKVELPHWLESRISPTTVLAISPRYFELTGGLERFLYQTARKHAGRQNWTFKLQTLYARSAARMEYPRFRFEMRRIVERSNIPDYQFAWRDEHGEARIEMTARSRQTKLHAW
jgi:plasmid replication initiation protein